MIFIFFHSVISLYERTLVFLTRYVPGFENFDRKEKLKLLKFGLNCGLHVEKREAEGTK